MLLDELTPTQAFELFTYAGIEPFGEVRHDMRMGWQMQQRYDLARGGKGKTLAVADFMLYRDIADAAKADRMAALIEKVTATARARSNGG